MNIPGPEVFRRRRRWALILLAILAFVLLLWWVVFPLLLRPVVRKAVENSGYKVGSMEAFQLSASGIRQKGMQLERGDWEITWNELAVEGNWADILRGRPKTAELKNVELSWHEPLVERVSTVDFVDTVDLVEGRVGAVVQESTVVQADRAEEPMMEKRTPPVDEEIVTRLAVPDIGYYDRYDWRLHWPMIFEQVSVEAGTLRWVNPQGKVWSLPVAVHLIEEDGELEARGWVRHAGFAGDVHFEADRSKPDWKFNGSWEWRGNAAVEWVRQGLEMLSSVVLLKLPADTMLSRASLDIFAHHVPEESAEPQGSLLFEVEELAVVLKAGQEPLVLSAVWGGQFGIGQFEGFGGIEVADWAGEYYRMPAWDLSVRVNAENLASVSVDEFVIEGAGDDVLRLKQFEAHGHPSGRFVFGFEELATPHGRASGLVVQGYATTRSWGIEGFRCDFAGGSVEVSSIRVAAANPGGEVSIRGRTLDLEELNLFPPDLGLYASGVMNFDAVYELGPAGYRLVELRAGSPEGRTSVLEKQKAQSGSVVSGVAGAMKPLLDLIVGRMQVDRWRLKTVGERVTGELQVEVQLWGHIETPWVRIPINGWRFTPNLSGSLISGRNPFSGLPTP